MHFQPFTPGTVSERHGAFYMAKKRSVGYTPAEFIEVYGHAHTQWPKLRNRLRDLRGFTGIRVVFVACCPDIVTPIPLPDHPVGECPPPYLGRPPTPSSNVVPAHLSPPPLPQWRANCSDLPECLTPCQCWGRPPHPANLYCLSIPRVRGGLVSRSSSSFHTRVRYHCVLGVLSCMIAAR